MSDFYGDSAELLNSPKAKVNRILVVGSGGREHAIIKALIKNTNKNEIICFGNNRNPGIEKYARIVIVDPINIVDVITHLANFQFNFQFAIIGPENPIALGIVNEIEKHGMTTLQRQHISMGTTSASLKFIGKKGVENKATIKDRFILGILHDWLTHFKPTKKDPIYFACLIIGKYFEP